MTSASMTELVHNVNSPDEISGAAFKLRQVVSDTDLSPNDVITFLESWGKALDARELDDIPGIVFLRMWLRRGSLEPMIAREFGPSGMDGGWNEHGLVEYKTFPLGVV